MAGQVETRTPLIERLATDLRHERLALVSVLGGRSDEDWDAPTPAERWTVRDQIAHLAHFDALARRAIAAPAEFIELRAGLGDLQEYVDDVGEHHRDRPVTEILQWWAEENEGLCVAAVEADPAMRVPWFGPSMSLASKLTARIMETWAHGQDVVDAFGLIRPGTGRLQHVARLGVLAFANSFTSHGLTVPAEPISVTLDPPDGGAPWIWGAPDAENRVSGTALDFCLVVTQRRHLDDTGLMATGPTAQAWMGVAQAFAGPPGKGRPAGTFAGTSAGTFFGTFSGSASPEDDPVGGTQQAHSRQEGADADR